MNPSSNSNSRIAFILALWGLLFTKCFTLEFLVRHYDAPINSLSYVWGLSIIMASVATFIYANLETEKRDRLISHPNFLVMLVLGIGIIILVAKSLLAPNGSAFPLALSATGLAVIQLMSPGKISTNSICIALAWLVSAMAIASTGQPLGFLIFAVSILLLSFLPRALQYLALRRGNLVSHSN